MPAYIFLQCLLALLLAGMGTAHAQERLRFATTTSVQDTGLLPYLLPHFEKKCNCRVDVIAVGTGQALKLAANGDVDLVLVHDPQAEAKFVASGFGVNRRSLMVNDFVILAPPADPARIRGIKDAAKALAAIHKTRSTFISRGDDSGTHRKELALWEKAGLHPEAPWYLEVGQGMGAVLTMANEKPAYTLADRGTYLARKKQLRLILASEGDPELLNYYSVIQVNPSRFPAVKAELSRQLADWLCTAEAQQRISSYAVGGNKLFKPVCKSGK